MNNLHNMSVLITTFLRDGSLELCIGLLRANLPDVKIIVVDDGHRTEKKTLLYTALRSAGHIVIECPFDTGLAEKRNVGIKACQTEYLLMGCDDFVFDCEARAGIEKLLSVLNDNPTFALASGRVMNVPYEGFFEIAPGDYVKEHPLVVKKEKPFYKVDLTVNYFLARVELIRDVVYDSRMKIGGEHGDYFLEMKRLGRTVVWVPGVSIKNMECFGHIAGNDDKYEGYRGRARYLGHQMFLKKYGVRHHIGFDMSVEEFRNLPVRKTILIAIVTCHKNSDRQKRVRASWLTALPPHVEAKFFFGRGGRREPKSDEVFLGCRDDYAGLPEKARGICAYSISNGFDWTFKVDDDTDVNLERLLEQPLSGDYVGRKNHCWGGFASGGPGFWLSAKSAKIISQQALSNDTADDRWIGQVLAAYGIKVEHSDAYVLDSETTLKPPVTICRVLGEPDKPLPPDPEPIVVDSQPLLW